MSFARASIGGKSAIAMAAAQKREAFSFPFLEAPAIVAHLHEMGIIGVEEDDITKGRPEAVRYLYEQLIYACTGLTREALYTPRLVEDSSGPIPRFPELHDEAISMLHFLRALNKLLVASGVHEGCCLRDATKPDPMRVKRNVSAIINFQKFREEKIEAWATHGQRLTELQHMKAQLEAERRDLEAQLQRERNLRAMEQPAISELQAAVGALAGTKAELLASASRLAAGIEEQRRTIGELKDSTASLEVKAEGLRGDIEAARSQIVASPARLRGEVEHAGRLVEDARTALAAAHGETAALQRRREVVAKATKDVGKCLSLMGEVDGEVRKLKAVSKEVKGKGAAREERAAEAAELQEQVARMERRVRAAEEKLEEAKRSAYVKQEATQRANQALREELQNATAELERARDAQAELAKRMSQVKQEHDKIQAAHNSEMAEMVASMRLVQKTVTEYHGRLFAAIAETTGASASSE